MLKKKWANTGEKGERSKGGGTRRWRERRVPGGDDMEGRREIGKGKELRGGEREEEVVYGYARGKLAEWTRTIHIL